MKLSFPHRLRVDLLLASLVISAFQPSARAADAPHDFPLDQYCNSCHTTHNALGSPLTGLQGNANLCLSCHLPAGAAALHPFTLADQAVPWPGLPAGTSATGNSHRWDSSASGRVQFLGGAATPSTGTVLSGGFNTNVYPKTFTLTITTAGESGTARFNWTATNPGGGAGADILTGTNIALNDGITATFINGSNTSFQLDDQWNIHVRTDLQHPAAAGMVAKMADGVFACSTCHEQHSQVNQPFDPAADPFATNSFGFLTSGTNRHFLRLANDTEQMCRQCHINREVTNSIAGSHPVGIGLLTNAFYKGTTNLPLEKTTGLLRCETCHAMHYATANDGSLARMTNVFLCVQCHTLANTASGAHFSPVTGVIWPGGQYGSTLPTNTVASDRGSCVNCHQPHGWPDNLDPTNHYPLLMVERFDRFTNRTDTADALGGENLCYTCHDANGPSLHNVKDDFAKRINHPVNDAEQTPGRSVECRDCHEVHQAQANSHIYTTTATGARNQVSNPLRGVSGVAVNYSGLTNFVLPMLNRYSATSTAVYEYQICFKCHTAYDFEGYNAGTASFTSGSVAIAGSGTAWTSSLLGSWIIRSNETVSYVITNVVSPTSIQVSPAYAGTTAVGQGYLVWRNPPGVTPIYSTGTANFANNSTLVRGVGATWNAGFVGSWINLSNSPAAVYKIVAFSNATSVFISPAYAGPTAAGQNYTISGGTDLAQEFSPQNRSGHPVVAGLNNYPNSPAPKALAATAMKAPWASNLGSQTMMCSDCHITDNTAAAQGPHGSASQYMLRGPNAANWPNVTSFATSWCANCHIDNVNATVHTRSDHTAARCYGCHIVIPHGGKVSRLIATRTAGLPARYAWNNNPTTVGMTSFLKAASNGYSENGTCRTACGHHGSGPINESW